MRVATVRRYPAKSCGGEELAEVEVDRRGLVGDRLWAVVDEDGKLASGKTPVGSGVAIRSSTCGPGRRPHGRGG